MTRDASSQSWLRGRWEDGGPGGRNSRCKGPVVGGTRLSRNCPECRAGDGARVRRRRLDRARPWTPGSAGDPDIWNGCCGHCSVEAPAPTGSYLEPQDSRFHHGLATQKGSFLCTRPGVFSPLGEEFSTVPQVGAAHAPSGGHPAGWALPAEILPHHPSPHWLED